MSKGYVYLMCDANSDLYKIGVTRGSIESRLKKLQTGNGNEIHIISYFKTKNLFGLENVLHRYFMAENALNEWFSLKPEDVFDFEKTCKKYDDILNGYSMEKEKM